MAEILRLFFVMMSEMLGNQYFLSRNYVNAAKNLQYALDIDPSNKAIRKKIIICYSQTGEIQKAFNVFYNLIVEDIDCIINTDIVADDCPCPDLVKHYGKIFPYEENSIDLKLMLGILWLYCEVQTSLNFFKSVLEEHPNDERLKSISSMIEEKIRIINPQTH